MLLVPGLQVFKGTKSNTDVLRISITSEDKSIQSDLTVWKDNLPGYWYSKTAKINQDRHVVRRKSIIELFSLQIYHRIFQYVKYLLFLKLLISQKWMSILISHNVKNV